MQLPTPSGGHGRVVLNPVGDLDIATVPGLERALDEALDRPGLLEIVVDLAAVTFLDSTAVAALLRGAAEAVGRGATLRLTEPQPVVARVLRITAVGPLLGLPGDHGDPAPWRR
ncbi:MULTISPECIES: STAS domain-containing protein [Micromonospora]|uniref:Anti-sigma factor antagonist n=2 Tax=Micromonospora rifamycinica TaxID=291594 RepID=A0A1C5IE65_9ACTN|nr:MULTISPECIES: STAS domain-containing protein [Micromonospora]WFE64296.1 STAS domain-containing protein [Micromonospora sp. WMMD714]SCG56637.1 anti-sigma B factor antagonist [Micromonospora rifamycinica]